MPLPSPADCRPPLLRRFRLETPPCAHRHSAPTSPRSPAARFLALFLASRLAFLLLTYLAPALFHDPALTHAIHTQPPANPFAPWFYRDAQWFQSIVQHGYSYHGPGRVANVAFFPVYPLTIKLSTLLSPANSAVAAMLIANAAFLATLYLLRASAAPRPTRPPPSAPSSISPSFPPPSTPTRRTASRSTCSPPPPACWPSTAVAGGPPAPRRPRRRHPRPGRLPPLRLRPRVPARSPPPRPASHPLRRSLHPAALAAYLLFLAHLTGNPLAFVKAEAGLHRTATWPWQTLATSLADIPPAPPARNRASRPTPSWKSPSSWPAPPPCWPPCPSNPPPPASTPWPVSPFCCTAPVTTSRSPITSMSRYLFALAPLPVALARLGRLPACHALYLTLATGSLTLLASFTLCHMWGAWRPPRTDAMPTPLQHAFDLAPRPRIVACTFQPVRLCRLPAVAGCLGPSEGGRRRQVDSASHADNRRRSGEFSCSLVTASRPSSRVLLGIALLS